MESQVLQVIIGAVSAFFIAYYSVPILRKVAYKRDLYDKPDNDRKLHDRYIPSLGGVAIFLAFFIGFSISGIANEFQGYPYFAAALTLIFFTGLKDDIIELSAKVKLVVEIFASALIIFGSEMYINNFYGVFGVYEVPYWIGVLITFFTIIVVVNSYNLIDGIDGLAAGVGIIASTFFGIGFFVAGDYSLAVFSLMLIVALAAYLRYNFNPAQIFMGDTGSLVIGLSLSVLAINFIGLNENPAYTTAFGKTSPILPIAILALPLYDTMRVFIKRVRNGKSPFTPGRDHIHHVFLDIGFGHKATTIILYGCATLIPIIALSVKSLNLNLILLTVILSMHLLLPINGLKRTLLKFIGIDLVKQLNDRKSTDELKDELEKSSKKNVHSAELESYK